MSDLISRSELIKLFKEHMRTAKDFREIIVNIIPTIKNQPTAYDIDKVVEELEVLKRIYFLTIANTGDEKSDFAYENVGNALDKAIEIVKQGCVSDDVCEWRCDVYGRWHTKCHTLADNDPLEYKYCPYCGKKIKVKE